MLSITKRQSGRLAKLILEHSRYECPCDLKSARGSVQGIEPLCVAMIDLDNISHKYNTPFDFFGLCCMAVFFQIIVALVIHVFYLWDQRLDVQLAVGFISFTLALVDCALAVSHGDGTLTLAQRSETSTSGSAVLLDQDFTVILNGNQGVVEAIVESGFTLSGSQWTIQERRGQNLFHHFLGALCDSAYISVLVLCCLLFRSLSERWCLVGVAAILIISIFCPHSTPSDTLLPIFKWIRVLPPVYIIFTYFQDILSPLFLYAKWESLASVLSIILITLFTRVSRAPNCPIRSTKLLDALGHPRVRKWQFDTLPAAATFQCLLVCQGISRPIRKIDVAAFLDILVPDQRDIWKAWKKRVADRILYETDIDLTPTIPTFGDERQKQLKDLLDQAQYGYATYKRFFN